LGYRLFKDRYVTQVQVKPEDCWWSKIFG
jgi:hypothetical protein